MKRRILFVDDEPNVLEGIGRMLRGLRQEWDMEFAGSGAEALERMAAGPVEIVVTDMRMPHMDGAELLAEVRKHFPATLRIVLTGQCDKDAFLRSAELAHRFLTKPCDADTLKTTVKQLSSLKDLVTNERLTPLVAHIKSVPSLPAHYHQVVAELESTNSSIDNVARVIAQDLGMTAKVLQLANSALFGARNPIHSIVQATTLLGCDCLKALVLAHHVFSCLHASALKPRLIDAFWKHSLATCMLARLIARDQVNDPKFSDLASLAGMLHDIGTLVLSQCLAQDYDLVWETAHREQLRLADAEQKLLGTSHGEVGAYLLALWGLPDSVVEAVRWHHRPADSSTTGFVLLTAVHVADAITCPETKYHAEAPVTGIDADYLYRLGLAERLPSWQESWKRAVERRRHVHEEDPVCA